MQETSAWPLNEAFKIEDAREDTLDIDGVLIGFDGWDRGVWDNETNDWVRGRKPQPSNQLDFGNDKHTTDEQSVCVRQLGNNGWNDAMCSRTWSGAKKKNILMGHVCETRTVEHPIQATGEFEDTFIAWADAFLIPNAAGRWAGKIETFAARIRTNVLGRACVTDVGDPNYTGITDVDANGDALSQLDTIKADMTNFFTTYMSGCTKQNGNEYNTAEQKTVRINAFVTRLNVLHDKNDPSNTGPYIYLN